MGSAIDLGDSVEEETVAWEANDTQEEPTPRALATPVFSESLHP